MIPFHNNCVIRARGESQVRIQAGAIRRVRQHERSRVDAHGGHARRAGRGRCRNELHGRGHGTVVDRRIDEYARLTSAGYRNGHRPCGCATAIVPLLHHDVVRSRTESQIGVQTRAAYHVRELGRSGVDAHGGYTLRTGRCGRRNVVHGGLNRGSIARTIHADARKHEGR